MFDNIYWVAGKIPFMYFNEKIQELDIVAKSILDSHAFGNYNNITVHLNFEHKIHKFEFSGDEIISCWDFISEMNNVMREERDLSPDFIIKSVTTKDDMIMVDVQKLNDYSYLHAYKF